MEFKSVAFEGSDQVGKGDATQRFCNHMIEKKIPVTRIAFPIYASPIGSLIRMFLKEGIGDVKKLKNIEGTKRELEVRMMMYALNRFEALESILRYSEKYDGIFLFDRSPYSNALTIAYGLGGLKNISREGVKGLVKLGFESEKLMIEKLGLKNCVIQLKADNGVRGWEVARPEDADLYESKDVQEVANYVYANWAKLVGDGWNIVYTKRNGKWRDKEVIYKEVWDIASKNLELEKANEGEVKSFDIIDIAKDLYGCDVSELEGVDRYYKAIEESDKATMYDEALGIREYIVKHTSEVKFENKEVLSQVRSILEKYPECLDLMEHYLGNHFVDKFKAEIFG
ncbi:hypothetical protein K8R20_01975 [bacterium]|nr:hypothetical protein [bacterium]